MACHFVSEQDMVDYASMTSQSNQFSQSESDSCSIQSPTKQTFRQPILLQSESQVSQISDVDSNSKIKLPKGGCQVSTKIGTIQFSMVPETLKDSLNMGLDVPTIFIMPTHRFDKRFCLSVAEFEFPAYFSFFIKKRKVTLITDADGEQAIRDIFQETLLGPLDLSKFNDDFTQNYKGRPDIIKELGNFAKNPFNPSEALTVDLLVNFVLFNQHGIADLGQDVQVQRNNERFYIIENGRTLAKMKNKVDIMIDENNTEQYIKYGLFSNPNEQQYVEHYQPQTFKVPTFGVTVMGCSHGFDPKGSVSGYIYWVNGQGIMVDPPPYTSLLLRKQGIPSRLIRWVIISHNHADHDAGTFQKLLESERTTLISTATIKDSFVRKYAAMTGYTIQYIESLFTFKRAIIGRTMNINGGAIDFHYSLHSIPCLGFTISMCGKSIYFSGDTYYDPVGLKTLQEKGVISEDRYEQLTNESKWNCDLILHEAGVPPIHTPSKVLAALPDGVKQRLRLIHVASKDIPIDSGLMVPGVGFENTIRLIDNNNDDKLKMIKILSLVEDIQLFKQASITQLRQIFECAEFRSYTNNDKICVEDEIGTEFYIIYQGAIRIDSNNKQHRFVRYLHYGDYFGEGCFFDTSKRRANATAMSDVQLIVISKYSFMEVFQIQSEVMHKLEQLQVARNDNKIIDDNKFFSQLSSNQKVQLELMLTPKKSFKKGQMIQSLGVMASLAFFVYSGKVSIILPSTFTVQQATGSPIRITRKEVEQSKKRFSLPVPNSINLEQLQAQRTAQKSGEVAKIDFKTFTLTQGMFFGEVESILNKRRSNTLVQAIDDSELIFIQADSLVSFLLNNPGLQVLFKDSLIIE